MFAWLSKPKDQTVSLNLKCRFKTHWNSNDLTQFRTLIRTRRVSEVDNQESLDVTRTQCRWRIIAHSRPSFNLISLLKEHRTARLSTNWLRFIMLWKIRSSSGTFRRTNRSEAELIFLMSQFRFDPIATLERSCSVEATTAVQFSILTSLEARDMEKGWKPSDVKLLWLLFLEEEKKSFSFINETIAGVARSFLCSVELRLLSIIVCNRT